MYSFRQTLGPVDLAFTDSHSQHSAGGRESAGGRAAVLDVSLAAGETGGLSLLLADFAPGSPVADMEQVHGAEVVHATGPGRVECDALVTEMAGLVLMVRVADCVPVIIADPHRRLVGVAHAGRRGVRAGVVSHTVRALRDLGAEELTAWIGPHVCGACYEVPVDMQEELVNAVPATRCRTRVGTPGLDLGAGVRAQLNAESVAVHEVGGCTVESAALHSHRREGALAGRLAGLVRVRG